MSQLLAFYMGSLILRSIGIALIAGLFSWKIRNVAIRHAISVAVLGVMMLMPAVDYLLPPSWVPPRIQEIAARQPIPMRTVSVRRTGVPERTPPSAAPVTAPVVRAALDWWRIAAALYALVVFAMFARLAFGYRRLSTLHRTGRAIAGPMREEMLALLRSRWRIPELLESDAVHVPMTTGLFRPAVLLPADWKNWDDWKLRAVLLHEIAHVHRCDWGIAVIAAAAKCVYWMNPLAWFLERQLSRLAEQASDDASLCRIHDAARYSEILLEFAVSAQSGGRLMTGGVAMAQRNMKARIERVLGNPPSGNGIVKTAAWALVLTAAVPVIYAAAALQVTSEPAPAPIPASSAALGRNPALQTPAPGQQAAPTKTPATATQVRQNSSNPAAELREPFQTAIEYRKIQRDYEGLKEKLAQALEIQANVSQEPEVQRAARIGESVAFLQDQLKKMDELLRALQAAMQQQSQANPPSPPPSALLDLPDNEDDLRAYLEQLARLRGNPNGNSFSVFVTGIQVRTINMKVAGQDYAFGCESCSFFVGESAVSSASPAPSVPGIFVRLGSDGSNVYITCHAAKCNVMEYEILADGTQEVSNPRQLESGLSELFRASKRLRVVISKN